MSPKSLKELDDHLGDLLSEVDKLGLRENTIVMIMSDNGPMKQAMPDSGFTDMIYRGFKAEALEGGIRVNAFIRWPDAIKPGSVAGDMIHVSDLYTTFARFAQATEYIPTDRVVDGVDQSALMLMGDGYGRRDYIHMYEGPHLKATIKEQYKVHWPPPGSASFKLPVFDLYKDPREERPLQVQAMWSVAYFQDMRARHMALKKKYPDRPETTGEPYGGIAELRPETKKLLEYFYAAKKATQVD